MIRYNQNRLPPLSTDKPKKSGRKPKKLAQVEKFTIIQPEKPEPIKRGRKPVTDDGIPDYMKKYPELPNLAVGESFARNFMFHSGPVRHYAKKLGIKIISTQMYDENGNKSGLTITRIA